MRLSWRVELVQWLLVAAMFGAAAASWSYVPEQMPIHWNWRGEVDGYGSRATGLLLLPVVALGIYLLLLFLPRIDPGYANYRSFATAYNVIRVTLLLFMAAIYGGMICAALGYRVDVSALAGVAVGALFVVLGNFMGKLRPNWFVGVRTPWTLSSKLSWTKTHRLAGWLFIAIGLAVAACALLQARWLLIGTGIATTVCLVWIVVYSYWVYRNDPDRMSPAGTSPEGNRRPPTHPA